MIGNQTHCGMFMSEKFIKENPQAVKDGRISEGQYKPSDFYTNEYNPYFKG